MKELTPGVKISLAGFILTVLVLFTGLIFAYAQTQNMVDQNTQAIEDCLSVITVMHTEMTNLQVSMATVETHYDHIKESLDRIEKRLEN